MRARPAQIKFWNRNRTRYSDSAGTTKTKCLAVGKVGRDDDVVTSSDSSNHRAPIAAEGECAWVPRFRLVESQNRMTGFPIDLANERIVKAASFAEVLRLWS
jgi:hypothetical protein